MPAKRKKVGVRKSRTGLKSISLDQEFTRFKQNFREEVSKETVSDIIKAFVRDSFTESESKNILANPEYHFAMFSDFAAAIHWQSCGKEFPEAYSEYTQRVKEHYRRLLTTAQGSNKEDDSKPAARKISPVELLKAKVSETVLSDIDALEDEWTQKEKSSYDIYSAFQKYDLKPKAASIVIEFINDRLDEYNAVVNKSCDQLLEAFSHLNIAEVKRRVKVFHNMLSDLDKIQSMGRAQRKPRRRKTITSDKQIKALKYQKSNDNYKISSVAAESIIGATRLYTFNTKTRVITEYVTDSPNGFAVKGTTLKNFDESLSRSTRLRRPDDFLPVVLKRTPRQIDKEFQKLTTKISAPNGRINSDTILLRTLDK